MSYFISVHLVVCLPNEQSFFADLQVLNIFLRLAWMQSVLGFREAPFLHRTALTALVASLEIIRRGIWNFFRYAKLKCTIIWKMKEKLQIIE